MADPDDTCDESLPDPLPPSPVYGEGDRDGEQMALDNATSNEQHDQGVADATVTTGVGGLVDAASEAAKVDPPRAAKSEQVER